jgi:hypothetical protein
MMTQFFLTVALPAAVMVACAGLGWLLNNLANGMPADQRQVWLHRAASVALLLSGLGGEALTRALTPAEEATVATGINQFLALHKVAGKVKPEQVGAVLADLRLKTAQGSVALPSALTVPSSAESETASPAPAGAL